MNKLKRRIRAFFLALIMTLKGEAMQPPELRYPALYAWCTEALKLSNRALQVAETHGMDQAARQAFTISVDRRPLSMEVILQANRHNMTLEYPMLMDARVEHNLTTLYALNIDDSYRVSRLAEADDLAPPIRSALKSLADHLRQIPSNDPA